MAQGKLALLTTALCFSIVCLYLATSVSSTESLRSREYLPRNHDVSHKPDNRRNHPRTHRLGKEMRERRHYLVSFATDKMTHDNWTSLEIAQVFTEKECRDHGVNCGPNAFCAIGKGTIRRVCLCEPHKCYEQPEEFVCGADGMTYRNPCEIQFRSCMSGTNIAINSAGKCPNEPRYSKAAVNLGCGKQSVEGTKLKEGEQQPCYQFPSGPICGDDERVYENKCALDKFKCQYKTNVTAVNPKLCLEPDVNYRLALPRIYQQNGTTAIKVPMSECSKKNLVCHPYASCGYFKIVEKEGFFLRPDIKENHECICDSYCQDTYIPKKPEPVCGTDHVTYPSLCELRRTACYENRYIEEDSHTPNCLIPTVFQYQPKISDSTTTTTTSTTTLAPKTTKLPTKVSTTLPPAINMDDYVPSQVCAANKLYCNVHAKCLLHIKTQKPICHCSLECRDPSKEKACGTDGETYSNKCSLVRTSCLANVNTTFAYAGWCTNQLLQRSAVECFE